MAFALDSDIEFRVKERTLVFLPLILLFFGIIPIMFFHELVTTGAIDWSRETTGRRRIPIWLVYALGWGGFVFFVQAMAPMVKYYRDPLMFVLRPDALVINGVSVPLGAISVIRARRWRGDQVIRSDHGEFYIHAQLVAHGVSILNQRFGDRFEAKGFKDSPALFVGY